MAPVTPTQPVTSFRAGDTVRFTFAHPDYPVSEGWVLQYTLQGPSKLSVTATAGTSDWTVALTPTQSQALLPGTYQYQLSATLSGARYTLAVGTVSVLPDLVAAAAGSLQAQDERELAMLNAEILARASSDHTEYSIDGRALKRESLVELREWRDQLRARIARRRRGGRLATASAVFPARFGAAGE